METTAHRTRKRGFPAVFKEIKDSYIEESLNNNKPLVLYFVDAGGKILGKIIDAIIDARFPEKPKDVVIVIGHGLYTEMGVKRDPVPRNFRAIINPSANKAFAIVLN
jgi:hypothetical protein